MIDVLWSWAMQTLRLRGVEPCGARERWVAGATLIRENDALAMRLEPERQADNDKFATHNTQCVIP